VYFYLLKEASVEINLLNLIPAPLKYINSRSALIPLYYYLTSKIMGRYDSKFFSILDTFTQFNTSLFMPSTYSYSLFKLILSKSPKIIQDLFKYRLYNQDDNWINAYTRSEKGL
jgi:hypothetical protein